LNFKVIVFISNLQVVPSQSALRVLLLIDLNLFY
jgi:hypothetical protein